MERSPVNIEMQPGRVALALAVLVVVLVALFWHFVTAQVNFAFTYLGDWGHTLAVPLITAYLIWIERDRLLARPFQSAPIGLLIVVLGIAAYVITLFGPGFLQVHNAKAIGFATTIFGVAVVACGWSAMRVLWFPLLYLVVFGQFISPAVLAPVTERMQDIAAAGSYFMFDLFGFQTSRVGNLITLQSGGASRPLDIAEACSGMKMLMAFLALGTLMAWTGLPRMWQRVLLVMLGLPIAIFVNILRITMQGILDTYDAGFSVGAAHSTISMLWLIPALLLYLFFMWVLEPFAPEDESPEPQPIETISISGGTPLWFGTLLGVLAVAAIAVQVAAVTTGFRSIKEAAPLRAPLSTLPTSFNRWVQVGPDQVYTDTVVEVLGTPLYVDRPYALDGDPRNGVLHVHVAYYTGGATNRPHVPERCWSVHGMTAVRDSEVRPLGVLAGTWSDGDAVNVATGQPYPMIKRMHPVTGREENVHLPVGDFELRVTVFANPESPSDRLVGGYLFIANARLTPNALAVRRLAYNFESSHAYFCKLQFTLADSGSMRTDDELIDDYIDMVEDVMVGMMPELMYLLPDWPEYESTEVVDEE